MEDLKVKVAVLMKAPNFEAALCFYLHGNPRLFLDWKRGRNYSDLFLDHVAVGKTVRKLVNLRSLAYDILKVKLLILKLEINALPCFEILGSNHDEELRLRRPAFQLLFLDC
jgi:hypothetical protein